MKRPLIRVRSISNDTSRCFGEGCKDKRKCMRHTQIEKDKERTDDRWFSYIATMIDRDNGHCRSRIEID